MSFVCPQSKKLNRRTLYGQLFAQYRVPMQRLYAMSFVPIAPWAVAFTGQTVSHGAFSQCTHIIGWKTMPVGLCMSAPVK